ncbi:MAG: hypothetical protein HS113_13205 [Verrucomicrobiales bacterium]|nr:hypothetical protein [Verrucomicrobiales bacterium]
MKAHVTAIVESFEAEEITEAEALAKLQEITGRVVDAGWLRHYWNSQSLRDFVDRLCAGPIADWQQLTDDDAIRLIAEYFQTESPGRRDSVEDALDRRFGKPTGTLRDLIHQRDMSEPATILEELKRDTRIYL